jgi:hypothetical protein
VTGVGTRRTRRKAASKPFAAHVITAKG